MPRPALLHCDDSTRGNTSGISLNARLRRDGPAGRVYTLPSFKAELPTRQLTDLLATQ
jgi:hypothetical protein